MTDRNIINFSFGSNMSTARLLARLPQAQLLGVGKLSGYRLTFDMLSTDGSAKCSITTCHPSSEVYGVLYALNHAEKRRLDEIEGSRYHCRNLAVEHLGHGHVEAWCYIANTFIEQQLPYDWYVQHVLAGAREHQLPSDYINAIADQQHDIDPDTTRRAKELAIYNF